MILDTDSRSSIESLVVDLLSDFGGGACFLLQTGESEGFGMRFAAVTETPFLEAIDDLAELLDDDSATVSQGTVRNVSWLGADRAWTFSRRFSVLDGATW